MDRLVIRPRIQRPILIVLFTMWGLLGANFFFSGDVVARRDWFGISLGILLIVMGVWGIWRSVRLGVVIDAHGITIRGLDSRDQVTPWSDVRSIECLPVDQRAGLLLYAPVIHLTGGEALPIRALGSYSSADAERKTEQFRGFGSGVDQSG